MEALLNTLETAIRAETTKAVLVDMWNAGDKHAAARAYVENHLAATTDSDCAKPVILGTEKTPSDTYGDYDTIDVRFRFEGERKESCFTVWLEDVGYGPFLYGEW